LDMVGNWIRSSYFRKCFRKFC